MHAVSPEDLVIVKLIASHPTDLEDVRGTLASQCGSLEFEQRLRAAVHACAGEQCQESERLLKQAGIERAAP